MEKATLSYSKLKQIVKENVKAVLSDNKILISIAFAAIIQTLKIDPQMVNLILNIPSANDGEQNEENNNNAIKYLEFNKDSLLYLAEKSFENLVEVLTNSSINNATHASSNPKLSVSSPSSKFNLGSYNQRDNYRIEDSESFHNNKSDSDD